MDKKVKKYLKKLNNNDIESVKSIINIILESPPEQHFVFCEIINILIYSIFKEELSKIDLNDLEKHLLLKKFSREDMKVLSLVKDSIIENKIILKKDYFIDVGRIYHFSP
jgi:hypothetical protein